MLSLTKALKEQTLAAREVIHKDTTVIDKAHEVADKNAEKLSKETERLREHAKFSCRCWIWLLLFCVTITFIGIYLGLVSSRAFKAVFKPSFRVELSSS